MFKGFKEFILRGNVVELATAVIIGAAFNSIVESFTKRILEPLINSIPGGDPSKAAEGLGFCVGDCVYPNPNNANPTEALNFINLGAVISATVNFLIVAAVVYFIIVLPYNKLSALMIGDKTTDTEVSLLTEIRNLMDPDAESRAAAQQEQDEQQAAQTALLERELPPPPPPIAPLAGNEPLIRPSTSNPPSGAIPRWEPSGYAPGAQRPPSSGGYQTGAQPIVRGGYPTGSQPPVSGGDYPAPPQNYPSSPGRDYPPPPFPGQDPDLPDDHPGRHSR